MFSVCVGNEVLFFLKILFIFRQRRREGEREGEKHECVVASCSPPTGDLAHSPDVCLDWELNRLPFGSRRLSLNSHPARAEVLFIKWP